MRRPKNTKKVTPNCVYYDTIKNRIILVRKPQNFNYLTCEVDGLIFVIGPWFEFKPQVVYIGKY